MSARDPYRDSRRHRTKLSTIGQQSSSSVKKEELTDDDAWGHQWAGSARVKTKAEDCESDHEADDDGPNHGVEDLESDHEAVEVLESDQESDDGGYGDAVFDDHEINNNLLTAVAHKINWLCRHGWKEYNLTKTHNKLKLKDVLWVVQNDWVFRWCTDTDSEQVVMKVINDTVRARDQQHRFCVVTDKITGDDYVQCIQSSKERRKKSKGKGKGKLSKNTKVKVRAKARGSAGAIGARFGAIGESVVPSPRAPATQRRNTSAPIGAKVVTQVPIGAARAPRPPPPPLPPPAPPRPAHPSNHTSGQEVVAGDQYEDVQEAHDESYIYGRPGGPKLVGQVKHGPKPAGIVVKSGQSLLRAKSTCMTPPHFLPGGFLAPPPREF